MEHRKQPVCSGTFYIYPENATVLAEELRGMVDLAWGSEVMDYGMKLRSGIPTGTTSHSRSRHRVRDTSAGMARTPLPL